MPWNNTIVNASKALVFTPDEYKSQYLWGIPLCNPYTNQSIPTSTLKQQLQAAQTFVENYLGLKLFKQIVRENKDFIREEFQTWGYLKTSYTINEAFELNGVFNEQQIIKYPHEWLSIKRSSDSISRYRELYIVPNGLTGATFTYLGTQFSQYFGFAGARLIPNYWRITYCTGFETIPMDIINIIGKIATVTLLPIIEMTVTGSNGSTFGLASTSLSLDGLSQSISKANGGNVFGQRLKQYGDEIMRTLPQLKGMYSGLVFDSM